MPYVLFKAYMVPGFFASPKPEKMKNPPRSRGNVPGSLHRENALCPHKAALALVFPRSGGGRWWPSVPCLCAYYIYEREEARDADQEKIKP